MTFEPQFGTRGLELAMCIRTSLAWIRPSMVISSMASTASTDLEALTSDELGDRDKDNRSKFAINLRISYLERASWGRDGSVNFSKDCKAREVSVVAETKGRDGELVL